MTLRNNTQWKIIDNNDIFIQENTPENTVCEATAILINGNMG